jgi:hypothetical protein
MPSPVDPGEDFGRLVEFAKGQDEYNTLVGRYEVSTATAHFKLHFTDEERVAIAAGQDLMFGVLMWNAPLQPMNWYVEEE